MHLNTNVTFFSANGEPAAHAPMYVLEDFGPENPRFVTRIGQTDHHGMVSLYGDYCGPVVVAMDGGSIVLSEDGSSGFTIDEIDDGYSVALVDDERTTLAHRYGTPGMAQYELEQLGERFDRGRETGTCRY